MLSNVLLNKFVYIYFGFPRQFYVEGIRMATKWHNEWHFSRVFRDHRWPSIDILVSGNGSERKRTDRCNEINVVDDR